MTPDRIHLAAQVVLYLKFMAVRLLKFQPSERIDAARLFLDIYGGSGGAALEGTTATEDDAEDLLALVASGFDDRWLSNQGESVFDGLAGTEHTLSDLLKTSWLLPIVRPLLAGQRLEADATAYRFLQLRAQVFCPACLPDITPADGAQVCAAVLEICQKSDQHERKTTSHAICLDTHRRERIAKNGGPGQ